MQFNSRSSNSINSSGRKLMSVMALALLALCFAHVPAQAQEQTRQITIVQDMVTVGLVPGQTLSITLSNPEDSGAPVSGHVKAFNSRGLLVFETPVVEIAPGEFHSFEIDRADIALPGDPRTGRFEVAARVTTIREVNPGGARARIDKLPHTIELIDNATGQTTALLLPAIQKVREAAR